jgi:hypothetical protein
VLAHLARLTTTQPVLEVRIMAKTTVAEKTKVAEGSSSCLSQEEMAAVVARLHDVAYSLKAIHELSFVAEENRNLRSAMLHGVRELARSTFKGVDACIGKLNDGIVIGHFATEFDNE